MQQNATEIELTEAQEIALAALVVGKSDTDAAKEADVDRTTLYRWRKNDFNFKAALNRARREMREAVQARLFAIAARATDTVEKAITDGDAKVALQLLRDLRILDGRAADVGDDDPARLKKEQERNDDILKQLDV